MSSTLSTGIGSSPAGLGAQCTVTVGDDGAIEPDRHRGGGDAARARRRRGRERVDGFVVPGMPNAHSHAFQRGMAGNTEYRLSARDSFWTWRQAMYALANRITPEDLKYSPRQLFVEMLKAGYTSVAEFHYLHRQPDGDALRGIECLVGRRRGRGRGRRHRLDVPAHALSNQRFRRGTAQAGAVAFRVRHRGVPASGRRARLRERRERGVPHPPHRSRVSQSARGAACDASREAARGCGRSTPTCRCTSTSPSKCKEVEACLAHTGPAAHRAACSIPDLLDRHWCLVHATHATAAELKGIADAGAAVCVSISTEANLGDGFFDAARFLKLGGRVCVGSDSQATVSPAEELRWMEYQAAIAQKAPRRTRGQDRNACRHAPLARRSAARERARIGQPAGIIEVGRARRLAGARCRPSQHGGGDRRERPWII